ncbi:type 1 glutamine amidotransferase domain-containing protein [Stenotrophomonas oahuensis]|uniref:Type 1 glutamine amidotransferase domain-containing protein n=1 Tax=Stenotrophomonas oahuensis TaxID=3003271 RepID=A0ABY9YMW0_9GAMM|nr:type 1 glutamine amidotransferase domain-containing protein [Stenotrophomonas sp. A5586]WNH52232.1 type 1 glutamine amidotransferase domain-containing protein [Stenotrophomonas sp. A5586]
MLRTILAAILMALPLSALSAPAPDTVLMIVSGEGRDAGKTRPGYEFDEVSQAWLIFKANGLAVEVASPQGGPVEADKYNPEEPFNTQLLTDQDAMGKLANTRRIADLQASDYAAVYVVGGKGAMFDLPRHAPLQALITDAWQRGAVVAAVCHGPAALAPVRLADGTALVAGRKVTGFSNEEEALFGKKWAKEFPWLLEDALRERGGQWSEAPLMMPHVVTDGRLVTGQNPYSTPGVAEAIVRAMGRSPLGTPART